MIKDGIHRDYIVLGSEVHIDMFDDRVEITSPGGMFGGGAIQEYDIYRIRSMRRNPVIADLFHRMKYNVNYHQGQSIVDTPQVTTQVKTQVAIYDKILAFCATPHSKIEITEHCGYKNTKNFTQKYLRPLLDSGILKMTIPDKPNSRNQRYITIRNRVEGGD